MAKKESAQVLERTYNIPLRKEYMKVPRWKRTKKAVSAVRMFLSKHMKSENVKLGKNLNEKLWKHGIKNPPHHIKVLVKKDDKGVVNAELFETQTAKPKTEKKSATKEEPKVDVEEKKADVKETPKAEAKPAEKKE